MLNCKHTFNPLYTNGYFLLVWYNTLGDSPLYTSRGIGLYKKMHFFCLKIFFTLTNSVDPDEMSHFFWVFTVCKSTCIWVSYIYKGLISIHFHLSVVSKTHFEGNNVHISDVANTHLIGSNFHISDVANTHLIGSNFHISVVANTHFIGSNFHISVDVNTNLIDNNYYISTVTNTYLISINFHISVVVNTHLIGNI